MSSLNVVATAVGKGFPGEGQTVVTNSTAGVSHTKPFVLPLQNTFLGFAQARQVTLGGPYRVTLRCTDQLNRTTSASFSGIVDFSDSTHYTAPATPKALVDEILADPAQPMASNGATGAAPVQGRAGNGAQQGLAPDASSGSGTGAASAGSTAQRPGASGASQQTTPSARTSTASSSSGWVLWIAVLAAALIGGSVLLRRHERRAKAAAGKARLNDERTAEESLTAATPSR